MFLPLKWQTYAVTRTGTTVKSAQIELISATSGRNLGVVVVPSIHFTIAIPAVITRKTKARKTATAEVCLKESAQNFFPQLKIVSWHYNKYDQDKKTYDLMKNQIYSLPMRLKLANGANTPRVVTTRTKNRPVHHCCPNQLSNRPA